MLLFKIIYLLAIINNKLYIKKLYRATACFKLSMYHLIINIPVTCEIIKLGTLITSL